MKIKKMYQGTVPENKILNMYSTSNTDTYSCNYANAKFEPVNFQSQVTFSVDAGPNCHFYKTGKIVTITYQGSRSTHAGGDVLFTLPQEYRPNNSSSAIYCPFVNDALGYGNVEIATSTGIVKVNQISSTTVTGRIYFSISYTVN